MTGQFFAAVAVIVIVAAIFTSTWLINHHEEKLFKAHMVEYHGDNPKPCDRDELGRSRCVHKEAG